MATTAGIVLCDIKELVLPPSLPPFALTLIVLLCALLLLAASRFRAQRGRPAPTAAPKEDSIMRLKAEYQQGGLSTEALFERLWPLVVDGLREERSFVGVTSDDLRRQPLSTPEYNEPFHELIRLCDLVRYAAYRPQPAEVSQALAVAAAVLKQPHGAPP